MGHRVTIPEIIKSQYNPAIDKSYKVELSPRFKNADEKFIMMDGKRKVGRQRIPVEFLKREEMLKKAIAGFEADCGGDQSNMLQQTL